MNQTIDLRNKKEAAGLGTQTREGGGVGVR